MAHNETVEASLANAQSLGANAVFALRFSSTDISRRAVELLVYGKAVVIEAEK